MKKWTQLELSNELGLCSGGIASILEHHYKPKPAELDNAILENYGFLLAYLCVKGGLDLDEAGSTIACFVGVNCGNDASKFYFVAKAMQFYGKHLKMLEDNPKDFLLLSIVTYNLLRPATWDDFSGNLHIEESNCLQILELWINIQSFLIDELPKRVNPILEKIDA